MALSVLSVAYPFAPVGPAAVGGAEQVLGALDRGLVRAGHRSIVLACEGSESADELVTVPLPQGEIETAREPTWALYRQKISELQARVDLVHLHGIDFAHYLPPTGRVVVTLHLPLDWYDTGLSEVRPDVWRHGVSESQYRKSPAGACLQPPIANGVDLEMFHPGGAKRGFALFLGRICPEKGVHLAIEAAERAGLPLLIAGQVFPYAWHQAYFAEQVAPRLAGPVRFLGAIGPKRKRRLLAAARCLLVPSLAEETSSLVAMEALACGTPVVAFRRGALPDVVEHGRTGFIVDDAEQMAQAIVDCDDISFTTCREAAVSRFALDDMIERYLALYRKVAASRPSPC